MAKACETCGQLNPDEAAYCNRCGGRLIVDRPALWNCSVCGHQNQGYTPFCGQCGAAFGGAVNSGPPSHGAFVVAPQAEASYMSADTYHGVEYRGRGTFIGGLLTLLCGLLSLGGGVFIVLAGNYISSFDIHVGGSIVVCGILIVIMGLIAIVGGNFAFRGNHFLLVLTSSVIGLFSIFLTFGLLGLVLGVAAVIAVAIGKDEFVN
jgi:hypothetical protein